MTLRDRIEDAFLAVLEEGDLPTLPREFTIRVPLAWTEGVRRMSPIRVGGYTLRVESERET